MYFEKPKFCPDPNCECLCVIADKLSDWEFGKSYDCIGRPTKVDLYIAGKTEHKNDLSHCIWTVRGWMRYFINPDDIGLLVLGLTIAFLRAGGNPAWIKKLFKNAFRNAKKFRDDVPIISIEDKERL